jgi:hypothetical protein
MIKYVLFNHIHITYYIFSPISTINYHGCSIIFTSPPNPITHFIVSSLKKIKGKRLVHQIKKISWFILFFSHLITCAFVIKIYSCKWSWKDVTQCLIAYEPPFKSQKQLHFHLFWGASKNGWYKCIFHFHPNWNKF